MMRFVQTIAIALALVFVTTNVKAQESIMNIGADLGIFLPTGDFSDDINTSFGFSASFEYMLQPNLSLTGTLGYISWSIDDEELDEGIEMSMSTIPIIFGGRYYIATEGFQPFVGVDLGFYKSTVEVDFYSLNRSNDETDFGFSVLAGALYPITEEISFRGILSFTNIFNGKDDISDWNFLAIRFGAIYRL